MAEDRTEAERAYQAAVELVERAQREGSDRLSFDAEEFRALDRIPPGLEKVKGLVSLDFDQTAVIDLSPLAALTGLQILRLTQTAVSDFSPLAALTSLQSLWLDQTAVSDLSPLAALTGLQDLSLDQTAVSDLSPLAALTGLQTLSLNQTAVSDLSPLAALTGLLGLRLTQTAISDLSPLAALTGLQDLTLAQTAVSDLSPLAALTGLQYLWLNQTAVSDLSPLAALTGLQTLSLTQTAVSDLSPLAALTGLQDLSLNQTAVSDLRPIRDLKELGEGVLFGLSFANTPATARDPELARLAAIEDHAERTKQTLAYLKTLPPWPEPLPWLQDEPGPAAPLPMATAPSASEIAQGHIRFLLAQPLITRVTARQLAAQIEDALSGVPSAPGSNQLPAGLREMAEVADALRHLAPEDEPVTSPMLEAELRLRIAHLEAVVDKLTLALADERIAKEAAEALARKDGFWQSYKKAAGAAAATASVAAVAVGIPSVAVYFLGVEHPAVQAVLTVLGRLPKS